MTVAGAEIGKTNEQGWFFLSDVPAGERVSVCFIAEDFVTRCRNITLRKDQTLQLTPTELMPVGTTGQVNAVTGGAVQDVVTGARFAVQANRVCAASGGAAVTGSITCSITPLNVTSAEERSFAPGDYSARSISGSMVQLVTSGMMDISCADAAGKRVNLCSGQSAEVRIPIYGGDVACATDSVNPPLIPSWGFNENSGLWEETSTFTRVCNVSGPDYYEGAITHLSYWNADVAHPLSCAKGNVASSNGQPVDGARIVCEGVDYQGSSETYTKADGTFCTKVKPGGHFQCRAGKNAWKSPLTASIAAPATQETCDSAACSAVGTLLLDEPAARMVLTWGDLPADLDSHLVGPNNLHIYYGNQGSSGNPVLLDTDDTSSRGPEITTVMTAATAGVYRFCVHNYSGESSGPIAASGAVVDSYVGEERTTHTLPAANPGGLEVWRVLEFTMDATGAITNKRPLDEYVSDSGDVDAACRQ